MNGHQFGAGAGEVGKKKIIDGVSLREKEKKRM